LIEILNLVNDILDIKVLPSFKDTLIRTIKSRLPLRLEKRITVKLDRNILPLRLILIEEVIIFDISLTFRTILLSNSIRSKIFSSLSTLIDRLVEI
jgi:hypothetical protein